MNVKVRMPKLGKKLRTKKYWIKELLMTILATSISIVLTFGTAHLIEHRQKMKSQHRMAMMVVHDIDETIRQMEKADSLIRAFSDLQLSILEGKYDGSRDMAKIELTGNDPDDVKFAETTKRIFTSNVDTWSTIGKVDFIDNVSGCYLIRDEYQAEVIDPLHKRINPGDELVFRPLDELLHIDVDYYVAYSTEIIHRLKAANELNKQIMGISDSELDKFTEKMVGINQDDLDSVYEAVEDEYMQSIFKRSDAMQKYYSKKATKKSNKKKNSKRKQNKR